RALIDIHGRQSLCNPVPGLLFAVAGPEPVFARIESGFLHGLECASHHFIILNVRTIKSILPKGRDGILHNLLGRIREPTAGAPEHHLKVLAACTLHADAIKKVADIFTRLLVSLQEALSLTSSGPLAKLSFYHD